MQSRRNSQLQSVTAPHIFSLGDVYSAPKHFHKEVEVISAVDCSIDIFAAGAAYSLKCGDTLVIGGGVVHRFGEKPSGGHVEVLKFCVDSLIYGSLALDKEEIYNLYDDIVLLRGDSRIQQEIENAANPSVGGYSEYYVIGSILRMTAYLLSKPLSSTRVAVSSKARNVKETAVIIEYLRANVSEDINLNEIAEYLGFAPSYCSKYIRKKTGMSFIECLNAIRVGLAEEILRDTEESITEIAFDVGFRSVQTFNRVFRGIKNMSPSSYRKLCRGGK